MCHHQTIVQTIVTKTGPESLAGRVGVAGAVLVVAAMSVHVAISADVRDVRDDGSYQAGYRAASNPTLIRETVIAAHTTPAALCTTLAEHALTAAPSPPLVRDDFISGCTHAIAETME